MRVFILILALAACASPRPKFYPNEHFKQMGEDGSKKDVDQCLAEAKQYLKENPLKPVAKHTWLGAVSGAVMGAAFGLVTGDFRRAVESGAAVGAAGGAASGVYDANTPDGVVRAYTDRCLAQRGYEVLGWR